LNCKFINILDFETPYGVLVLGSFQNKLVLCDWKYRKSRIQIDQRIKHYFNAEFKEQEDDVLTKTKAQLNSYFLGELKEFDVPYQLVGSVFQQQVWAALSAIPFGKTISYLQLSKSISNEKAIRAVASANGANALSIIVPCHRVVGSNGELTGYAGGIEAKKKLLSLEGSYLQRTMFN